MIRIHGSNDPCLRIASIRYTVELRRVPKTIAPQVHDDPKSKRFGNTDEFIRKPECMAEVQTSGMGRASMDKYGLFAAKSRIHE